MEQLKEHVDISLLLANLEEDQADESHKNNGSSINENNMPATDNTGNVANKVNSNTPFQARTNTSQTKHHSQQELTEITSLIINQLEPSLNEVGNG